MHKVTYRLEVMVIKTMGLGAKRSWFFLSFSAPAYISATSASESVISAAAAKAEVNKVVSPIKGNGGVYMIQVLSKEKNDEKYDAKQEGTNLVNAASRFAGQFINDLYRKAEIVDNRYLYF